MQENQHFFRQAKTGSDGLNRTHNPEAADGDRLQAIRIIHRIKNPV